MDWTSLPVVPTGAGALVALSVLLVLYGKLVPKSVVDDIRSSADREIDRISAERDRWKQAYDLESTRTGELTSQVTTLMEVARTANQVIRSLPAAGNPEGGRDETVSS